MSSHYQNLLEKESKLEAQMEEIHLREEEGKMEGGDVFLYEELSEDLMEIRSDIRECRNDGSDEY